MSIKGAAPQRLPRPALPAPESLREWGQYNQVVDTEYLFACHTFIDTYNDEITNQRVTYYYDATYPGAFNPPNQHAAGRVTTQIAGAYSYYNQIGFTASYQ